MPVRTCREDAPCFKDCYANRMVNGFRQNVKPSWERNTEMVEHGRFDEIREDIIAYIRFRRCGLFRWFVGGDIYSEEMLDTMIVVAEECPDTRFMCFTKKYWLIENKELPKNLNMVLSAWKDMQPSEELKKRFPVCYMDDGTPDCNVPDDALSCGGHCIDCQLCFGLRPGSSVKIGKH